MSPELRALIDDRRGRLHRHVDDHAAFIAGLERSGESPGLVEREAAAAMLHSFYTGVEFILRTIADGIDGAPPRSGASWHADLLGSMTRAGPGRTGVLSDATAAALRPYLKFRHRFRNLYGGELDWTMMGPLVNGMPGAFQAFDSDLASFLQRQGQGR